MKKTLLAAGSLLAVFALSSCNSVTVFENSLYVMNTIVTIRLYNDEDSSEHYKYLKDIYQSVDSLSNDFYEVPGANGVCELNEKRTIETDPLLCELVSDALALKEETHGYYNPLIGNLSHLWKAVISEEDEEKRASLVPSDETIAEELEKMNSTTVSVEGNTITINGEANLDLGGISKGFATMKAVEYLEEEGVKNYVISGGGSSVSVGSKMGSDFKIGLEKPYDTGNIAIVTGQNINISTSCPKYQHVTVGDLYVHHLISPFTGKPCDIYDSVNVMAENSMLSDCYSTAVFLMDMETAKAFAEEKGIDILLYRNGNILYETKGWCISDEAGN